jgi:lysophospholipase L1-like esterase
MRVIGFLAIRPWAVLLPLTAALLACGGGGGGNAGSGSSSAPFSLDTGAAPAEVTPGTWVVMGSSTAAGTGASAGQSWAMKLQASYADRGVSLVNIAKGGTTTYAGLSASTAPVSGRPSPDSQADIDAALARAPRLLLVSYPSNDTALGYSVDETVDNVLAIRAAALARGVAVILLSTQPRAMASERLALLPQIDARLSQAVGECFVAVRQLLAGPSGLLDAGYDSGDGVHPNDAGHALIHLAVRDLIAGGKCVRVSTETP